MALTLTEGELYSTTTLQKLVIDRLVLESEILAHLPFATIEGNSLTYNTVTTRSGAAFYDVGDTWVESTPSLTQATAVLKILGGDVDVDEFLKKTRSNIIDIRQEVLADKVKAIQEKFLDTFYYGSTTTDAKSFNGLHALITNATYNRVLAGSGTGTALSMLKLHEAIDLITGFKASGIFMSKRLRTYITKYLDSIGSAFPTGRDQWGSVVETFRGIPVYVDDNILNTETTASGAYSAKTGGGNTTIFILSFAGEQGACGLTNGGVQVAPLGNLETKDAERIRIKWYCGLMFQNIRSCAKVDGIDSDGTVSA